MYKYFFNNKNLKVTQGILNKDLNNDKNDIYKKLLEFDLLGECRNAVQYDVIEDCYFDKNKGLTSVLKRKNKITIIKNNQIIFDEEADNVQDVECCYEITTNNNYYFKDEDGERCGEYYEDAKQFNENFAAVMIDNYWGFIDNNGNIVKEPCFSDAYRFNNGFCVVADKYGRYGVINKSFEYIVKPQFELCNDIIQKHLLDDDGTEGEFAYLGKMLHHHTTIL